MEASRGWIDEIEFPATKQELIEAAADGDAPQELVERLQQLEHEQYESADEIDAELDADA